MIPFSNCGINALIENQNQKLVDTKLRQHHQSFLGCNSGGACIRLLITYLNL